MFIILENIPEQFFRNNRREILLTTIIEITAPLVFSKMCERVFRTLDFQCAPRFGPFQKIERIQVDVMQDIQKMRVVVDEYSFRPALEKGSNSLIPFVEIFCVADVELHQKFCNAAVNDLGDK